MAQGLAILIVMLLIGGPGAWKVPVDFSGKQAAEVSANKGLSLPGLQFAGAGLETYTLFFVDQNGEPVPEVDASFCTDALCRMVTADENGVAVFEGEPSVYHVQVVDVPEGYDDSGTEELYTEIHSCSLTITIIKE